MYKFCFFVPQEALESVKAACFAAGAGRIGDYDSCCWQVLGEGQFRPLAGSKPYIGSAPVEQAAVEQTVVDQATGAGVNKGLAAQGILEKVPEYRVEMVCEGGVIRAAVTAMKRAHPYEEPAYDVWQLESF